MLASPVFDKLPWLRENPGVPPIVETLADQEAERPVFDPEFLETALSLARDRALQARAGIATIGPDCPQNLA
jgi:hypothetical protein